MDHGSEILRTLILTDNNPESSNRPLQPLRRSAAVEVRHLQYCIAASDHGSFRKAAAALGVQMSTISRAIRDLEDRLGTSLFQRHVGGVELTYAGEQFLHRARIALKQVNAGIRDVNAVGRAENGRIRVGKFSSIAKRISLGLVTHL